jgi:hypothetical protein
MLTVSKSDNQPHQQRLSPTPRHSPYQYLFDNSLRNELGVF